MLCARHRGARDLKAKLWDATKWPDLRRIIDSVIGPDEYLVASPILRIIGAMDALKQTDVRGHLGIEELTVERLQGLVRNRAKRPQNLQLDGSEWTALVSAGITQKQMKSLPVWHLSEGGTGTADGRYWVGDWTIPDGLRDRVYTVLLSRDQVIRNVQRGIVDKWTPKKQIEVALGQQNPHDFRSVILQAIAEIGSPKRLVELQEPLHRGQWLGAGVAPRDVLNLPERVGETAGAHFHSRGDYITVAGLPEDVRGHAGFGYVMDHLIPDVSDSVAKLAPMIVDAGLVGRLGGTDGGYPINDFAVLVNYNLKLPGWKLLAAVLASVNDHHIRQQIVASFCEVTAAAPQVAGEHLRALASAAALTDDREERRAAKSAHRFAFGAVTGWPIGGQRQVFAKALVPTRAGAWHSGTEVVAQADGVAGSHVLSDEYYSMIVDTRRRTGYHRAADGIDDGEEVDDGGEVIIEDTVAQHRRFLQGWRYRVPRQLAAIYLWIVGRDTNTDIRDFCDGSIREAFDGRERAEMDALIRRDGRIELGRQSFTWPTLFYVQEVDAEATDLRTIAGNIARVPVADMAAPTRLVIGKYGPERRRGEDRRYITFKVLKADRIQHGESVGIFRDFVVEVARMYFSESVIAEVCALISRVAKVVQGTLKKSIQFLRDSLPYDLGHLKLPRQSMAHQALKKYERDIGDKSEEKWGPDKLELWNSVGAPEVSREVLEALREKIREHGYRGARVIFELFQNADDAYSESGIDDSETEFEWATFRAVFCEDGFKVIHWGRPINEPVGDAEVSRHRGYDRDLFNMLAMGYSEKRPDSDDAVTGKFGLGFKCVHLLSDSVGIASGFIAVRTVGAIIPKQWDDGLEQVDTISTQRRKATLIDVPFAAEMIGDGEQAKRTFMEAIRWLPAFARCIRMIEVEVHDNYPRRVDSRKVIIDNGPISVVTVEDAGMTYRTLRFDLGIQGEYTRGFSLLLKMGADGPECFDKSVERLLESRSVRGGGALALWMVAERSVSCRPWAREALRID